MSIELIMGPMFSGKTTTLINRIRHEQSNGKKVCVIKNELDKRYDNNQLCTHDGERIDSTYVTSSLKSLLDDENFMNYDVYCIDEGQFFNDLITFIRNEHILKSQVYVAALNGTFNQHMFQPIIDIIPFTNIITLKTAKCSICNNIRANMTVKNDTKYDNNNSSIIDIGGSEKYRAICTKCN